MKGADIVYNVIKRNCKHAFIYSGGAIMPLVDKFYNDSQMKYYINSTEHCSALSAVGYAKSSNKVGVCITTSGPGLTNTITGITDASTDSTPMVVISGQVPTTALGTQAFQEAPSVELTKPITKWSYQPHKSEELESVMKKAFALATNKKRGVVHIDLCKDILCNPASSQLEFVEDTSTNSTCTSIKDIANIINKSERPVIILGKGAIEASSIVKRFCVDKKIPTTSTIHAMGIVDENDALSLKFLGMHGSVYANYAVQKSDCIINLGSRFDDRITGNTSLFAPKAKIIHCNIESSDMNSNIIADYCVESDVGSFIEVLSPLIEIKERQQWKDTIQVWKLNYPLTHKKISPQLKQQDVIKALDLYMNKRKTIVTTGVGNHQMYACQFINWTYPNRFITSGSLGTMGVGLPYAIGCQIAHPDMTVIDIDGDGSFNMTLNDLKTVAEYGLPIKIIVLDDGYLSMVKVWEELFYDNRNVATTLSSNPDYCKLANAFGIESIYCDNVFELGYTIKKVLNSPRAILAHFKIETDKCFPLVAPGSALDDIIHSDDSKITNFSNIMPPS